MKRATIMLDTLKQQATEHMQKSLMALQQEFSKLRTARAHPSLLEHVMVDYYGNTVPLNQMATVNLANPQTLTISPWDKKATPLIEKAILKADLGLNPVNRGELIFVPMPPLSEERRKAFIKLARQAAEQARVAIRNIRRDINNDIKKDPALTKDEQRRDQETIQTLTDKHIALVDKTLADKERNLLAL